MPANPNRALTQAAGDHLVPFLRVGIFHPEQVSRELFAKAPMQFDEPTERRGTALGPTLVNPFLHRDMRLRLELEVAPLRIAAVIALQGALDIDRMGIVALDQVAVIAVHRPDELRQRGLYPLGQAAAQARGARSELHGQIRDPASMPGAFRDQQRFHQGRAFPRNLESGRVLFHDRLDIPLHVLYYSFISECYVPLYWNKVAAMSSLETATTTE